MLEEAYKKVKSMYQEYLELQKQIAKKLNIDESEPWRNPLNEQYKFQDIVEQTRSQLIEVVISEFQNKHPNIKLDSESLKQYLKGTMKDDFKPEIINKWLQEKYAGKERELSLKNIKETAKHCLSYKWENGNKVLNSRVQGNKIILRAYVQLSYGGFIIGYDLEQVRAIEKLSKIILEDADPISVEGSQITSFVSRCEGENVFFKHELTSGPIKSFKFYKNGRLDLEFKTKEQAEKVLKALLSEEVKPLLTN